MNSFKFQLAEWCRCSFYLIIMLNGDGKPQISIVSDICVGEWKYYIWHRMNSIICCGGEFGGGGSSKTRLSTVQHGLSLLLSDFYIKSYVCNVYCVLCASSSWPLGIYWKHTCTHLFQNFIFISFFFYFSYL